jgi:hypothetical protein
VAPWISAPVCSRSLLPFVPPAAFPGGTVDFGTGLLDSENGSIFVTRLVP